MSYHLTSTGDEYSSEEEDGPESAVETSEIQDLRRANSVLEDKVRTLERRLDETDAEFASTLERLVVEFVARLKGIETVQVCVTRIMFINHT